MVPADVDGDGLPNGVDFLTGRNHFQAPGNTNLDARFSRRFIIGDGLGIQAIFEFFNLLNRANPAAVEQYQNVSSTPLGKPGQYLPGREGQVGVCFEFQHTHKRKEIGRRNQAGRGFGRTLLLRCLGLHGRTSRPDQHRGRGAGEDLRD